MCHRGMAQETESQVAHKIAWKSDKMGLTYVINVKIFGRLVVEKNDLAKDRDY